jgi:hypothetical protein
LNIFYFIIKDVNIFSEIKTNLGLFNLKDALSLRLFINGGDATSGIILLKNLKIKYIY